jgi:hypothetical protein
VSPPPPQPPAAQSLPPGITLVYGSGRLALAASSGRLETGGLEMIGSRVGRKPVCQACSRCVHDLLMHRQTDRRCARLSDATNCTMSTGAHLSTGLRPPADASNALLFTRASVCLSFCLSVCPLAWHKGVVSSCGQSRVSHARARVLVRLSVRRSASSPSKLQLSQRSSSQTEPARDKSPLKALPKRAASLTAAPPPTAKVRGVAVGRGHAAAVPMRARRCVCLSVRPHAREALLCGRCAALRLAAPLCAANKGRRPPSTERLSVPARVSVCPSVQPARCQVAPYPGRTRQTDRVLSGRRQPDYCRSLPAGLLLRRSLLGKPGSACLSALGLCCVRLPVHPLASLARAVSACPSARVLGSHCVCPSVRSGPRLTLCQGSQWGVRSGVHRRVNSSPGAVQALSASGMGVAPIPEGPEAAAPSQAGPPPAEDYDAIVREVSGRRWPMARMARHP